MARKLLIHLLFLMVAARLPTATTWAQPAEGDTAAHQESCHASKPTDSESQSTDGAPDRDAAPGCCDVACVHACHAPAVLALGFDKGAAGAVARLTSPAPSRHSSPFAPPIDHVPLA
jgi:hypothetical protein